nr:hypothetical protein [Massilia genomosp. 1]
MHRRQPGHLAEGVGEVRGAHRYRAGQFGNVQRTAEVLLYQLHRLVDAGGRTLDGGVADGACRHGPEQAHDDFFDDERGDGGAVDGVVGRRQQPRERVEHALADWRDVVRARLRVRGGSGVGQRDEGLDQQVRRQVHVDREVGPAGAGLDHGAFAACFGAQHEAAR